MYARKVKQMLVNDGSCSYVGRITLFLLHMLCMFMNTCDSLRALRSFMRKMNGYTTGMQQVTSVLVANRYIEQLSTTGFFYIFPHWKTLIFSILLKTEWTADLRVETFGLEEGKNIC